MKLIIDIDKYSIEELLLVYKMCFGICLIKQAKETMSEPFRRIIKEMTQDLYIYLYDHDSELAQEVTEGMLEAYKELGGEIEQAAIDLKKKIDDKLNG